VVYQNPQLTEQQMFEKYSHMKLRAVSKLIPPDGEAKTGFAIRFKYRWAMNFLIKTGLSFPWHEEWFILNWKSSGQRISYSE